jgi:hypothetical protein
MLEASAAHGHDADAVGRDTEGLYAAAHESEVGDPVAERNAIGRWFERDRRPRTNHTVRDQRVDERVGPSERYVDGGHVDSADRLDERRIGDRSWEQPDRGGAPVDLTDCGLLRPCREIDTERSH